MLHKRLIWYPLLRTKPLWTPAICLEEKKDLPFSYVSCSLLWFFVHMSSIDAHLRITLFEMVPWRRKNDMVIFHCCSRHKRCIPSCEYVAFYQPIKFVWRYFDSIDVFCAGKLPHICSHLYAAIIAAFRRISISSGLVLVKSCQAACNL